MTNSIHPSSVVSPNATLGDNITIGPFCVVGDQVTLGDGCVLKSHVVIDGDTTLGQDNILHPFASIGGVPQDLKYDGEPTKLMIGDRNTIREQVTIHPGTVGDNSLTQIGDDNLLMIGVHIAHDCMIGNQNVFANNATMAGHVHVGNHVVVGGLSAVHQFARIGDHAMIGGMSGVEGDVIPFGLVMGERARLAGINLVGMDRRGFEKADIKAAMKAFKHLFQGKEGTFKERLAEVNDNYKDHKVVSDIIDFVMAENSRSLCQAK
ncbi:MAG: acyl-[acyl-carrier-protein]--UDP-N-acetylglucosamine O-acyltransferase [Alphaproteobacteria bacterium]|nr:MAG: acyl-[acyl-carrier-protein]--UDP-N-acetylglucosamine O-acyltransferase [Alphaproteobacteria bacterium]